MGWNRSEPQRRLSFLGQRLCAAAAGRAVAAAVFGWAVGYRAHKGHLRFWMHRDPISSDIGGFGVIVVLFTVIDSKLLNERCNRPGAAKSGS